MATIRCPNCMKSIGGRSEDGGLRIRVGIVLVDPALGVIKGPCPHCKEIVPLADQAKLNKNMKPTSLVPAFRLPKP